MWNKRQCDLVRTFQLGDFASGRMRRAFAFTHQLTLFELNNSAIFVLTRALIQCELHIAAVRQVGCSSCACSAPQLFSDSANLLQFQGGCRCGCRSVGGPRPDSHRVSQAIPGAGQWATPSGLPRYAVAFKGEGPQYIVASGDAASTALCVNTTRAAFSVNTHLTATDRDVRKERRVLGVFVALEVEEGPFRSCCGGKQTDGRFL